MNNFMKKFTGFTCAIVMIFSISIPAFASDLDDERVIKSNYQYGHETVDFLLAIEIDNLVIQNSSGVPVDDELYLQVTKKLVEKDYSGVIDLIYQNNISLSVEKRDNKESKLSIGTKSIASTVNFQKITAHEKLSSKEDYRQDWLTIIKGSYRENANGTLTALGSPSITVDAFWGDNWSINVSDIQTGYQYSSGNSAINYYANYKLTGDFLYLGFPIFSRSYGIISVSHRVA